MFYYIKIKLYFKILTLAIKIKYAVIGRVALVLHDLRV
ncbi:hypothetical protein TOPB45_0747 [Thermodesulfobacterium geofontis OPF15]|jgi:hypothetical protein|uniref:Uncharacterized protein n=1 Tax=Thermodesulfobacterium geofontis (strain OPF15) TaxID=795359 RepID=F8C581_THEGP|nr:hypothetical protein TOPB45_0747 [Thermodesulfobacterium geofontis OPF15]